MTAPSDGARAARARRLDAVRQRMEAMDVDGLLLSHGADLPWLTGYRAMPLERLTMLVLLPEGRPVLVVPALEAPRVPETYELFDVRSWTDGEDPVEVVGSCLKSGPGSGRAPARCAVSDRAWATTVLALQRVVPSAEWLPASVVTGAVRAVKDPAELAALRAAAAAADRVARTLHNGGIPLIGRTEAEVSARISSLLLAEGHQQVNFAIVGSGPNGASPHHEATERIIGRGETVVCDFGGALALDGDVGYCSDITRTVVTGPPSTRMADCYEVLLAAQQAAVSSARAGVTAEEVDRVARSVIGSAGLGEYFIHRTGHGIGIEEHEDPYLVSGNRELLRPGHAFSVEPGIYVPGEFGMRLEDIVVIDEDGDPDPINSAEHRLVMVDA